MAGRILMPNARLVNGRIVEKKARVKNYESCFYNGRIFDSRAEAGYAAQLDLLVRVGKVRSWTPQVTIELPVNGKKICSMRVDFRVYYPDGHDEWHEVKGFETREWEIKRNLFRALWPERQYVVIKAGGVKAKKKAWPKRLLKRIPV